MDKKQIFDDFPVVDCNTCQRYYDSECDGIKTGDTKLCRSYKATRSVSIPEEINRIKRTILWIACSQLAITLVLLIYTVSEVLK